MLNHLALILSAVLLLSQGLASESPEALVSTSDLASLRSALEPHSMKAREIMKGES